MAAPQPWLYLLEGEPDLDAGGGSLSPETVHFFSGPWNGLMASGVKAHAGLKAQLTSSVQIDHPLLRGGSSQGARFGEVVLSWGDGLRDSLFRAPYYWQGRPFRIKRAAKPATSAPPSLASFTTVFEGVVEDYKHDRERLSLLVRDKMLGLEQRVQRNAYAGTGTDLVDCEGPAELTDRLKPILLGTCTNVEPVLVDRANNIYQVHDGAFSAMQAVSGLFDKGVAYTFASNHANLLGLLGWTPVGSQYATCLAKGLVRTGNTPAGRVTVDAQGDAGDPDVPGFTDVWDQVIRRLAKGYGGLSGAEIGTLTGVARNVGLYTGSEPVLVREAIRQIAEAAFGFAVFDRLGVLRIGTLDLAGKSSVATIREKEVGAFRREQTPLPAETLRVGYGHAWTVQDEDDLAPAALEARRAIVSSEHRYIQGTTGAGNFFPHAPPITFDSLLSNATDAFAVIVAALDAHANGWGRYYLQARNNALQRTVGEVVTIVHPRFGFSAGRDALVLGVDDDLSLPDDLVGMRVLVPGG